MPTKNDLGHDRPITNAEVGYKGRRQCRKGKIIHTIETLQQAIIVFSYNSAFLEHFLYCSSNLFMMKKALLIISVFRIVMTFDGHLGIFPWLPAPDSEILAQFGCEV